MLNKRLDVCLSCTTGKATIQLHCSVLVMSDNCSSTDTPQERSSQAASRGQTWIVACWCLHNKDCLKNHPGQGFYGQLMYVLLWLSSFFYTACGALWWARKKEKKNVLVTVCTSCKLSSLIIIIKKRCFNPPMHQ